MSRDLRNDAVWRRHRDGDGSTTWTRTIDGTHVVVADMTGQSVAFTGVGRHVVVWVASRADDPFDDSRREDSRHYSVSEAKAWSVREYAR